MAKFTINAAGKQIFLDVFHTPSSTLPATEIPAEILKRFEAAGMPIVLERGVTQEAFAKAVLGAYTALGLSYRNRTKVQSVVPEFTFDLDELPTVEPVATITPDPITANSNLLPNNGSSTMFVPDTNEMVPDGPTVEPTGNYDLDDTFSN